MTRVAQLWRFPVKSARGERMDRCVVGHSGLEGDRQIALYDPATGLALTARREPRLLFLAAALVDGHLSLTTDDGTVLRSDTQVSAWLGRDVVLRRPPVFEQPEYEAPVNDFDEAGDWTTWSGPVGVWHDSTRTRVSLTTLEVLGERRVERFRQNVVLDAGDDAALVGTRIRIGTVELDVVKRIERCVVTTRPQPGGIERDPHVLRTIIREEDGCLGVGAVVVRPGEIAVGDTVERLP